MTRLTNDIRDRIIQQATQDAFKKRSEAIEKEEAALGIELYNSIYDKATRLSVKKLDRKWFILDKCLRFNCGGYDLRFTLKDAVPVPAEGRYGCHSLANISGELAEKAQIFAKKKEDEKNAFNTAKRTLSTVLYNVSTIKRLKEVWPEGHKFYSGYDVESPKSKGGLPAIQMEELNAMLGLKTAPKKAE